MSENYERVIRDLLFNEGNSDRVADNLLHRLRIESPGLAERQVFLSFIINAGFAKYAMELFEIWYHEKRRIPLYPFCYLLHRSGFQPRNEFLSKLLEANDQAGDSEPFSHFTQWEERNAAFKQLKDRTIEKLQQAAEEHYQQQLAKLEYLKLNRMIEEEEALLKEMLMAYPDDAELHQQRDSFRLRWAEAVIARKSDAVNAAGLEKTELNLTALELKALSAIADGMIEAAKQNPQTAYVIAIGLLMLDLFNPALEALQYSPKSLAADWLGVECLLKSRRFAEALDAISTVEGRYADDPETTFGATYARSLALEGLGQNSAAAELVRSIVKIRPSYRSAQSLLNRLVSGYGSRSAT